MKLIGILLLISGLFVGVFGIWRRTTHSGPTVSGVLTRENIEQMRNMWESTRPGILPIIVGVILFIIGLIILI